jgi:hypothetical protein
MIRIVAAIGLASSCDAFGMHVAQYFAARSVGAIARCAVYLEKSGPYKQLTTALLRSPCTKQRSWAEAPSRGGGERAPAAAAGAVARAAAAR